jgi:mannose-1-phosphate guanylyltransferase
LTRRITGAPIPKQYCRIIGERSLLEATLERVGCVVPPERTLVIINENHVDIALDHVTALPATNVLIQPCNRDTGPGLVMALLALKELDPEADVTVFPSDHFIRSLPGFVSSLLAMQRALAADPSKVVLLGIRPDRPDPGLGYILPDEASASGRAHLALQVRGFAEKPSRQRAVRIIRRGGLWSSFIMHFQLERMLDVVRAARSREMDEMERLVARPADRDARYSTLSPWNFSRDVLAQRTEDLVVVPSEDLGWSDWGTPRAVVETVSALGLRPTWLDAAAEAIA